MGSKEIIPIKDLSSEVEKLYKVMNEEKSDLACALIGASFLSECIGSVLKKKFRPNSSTALRILMPDKGFLGSFSNRADLCYCIGLVNKKKYNDLKLIAEIRNTFAHSRLNITFDSNDVVELTNNLNSYKVAFPSYYFSKDSNANKQNFTVASRDKYNVSVTIICQGFLVDGLLDEILA